MIIRNLRLKNFRTHADTHVEFREGVTSVSGRNGSGKTTLVTEAVLFALYGTKGIRKNLDTLRWNRAPARRQAEVELCFEMAGKCYRIVRTESDATLYEGVQKIAAGTSAVNAYMPGLIGLSLDEFASSVMVLQKDLDRIATMKPVERGAFFRSVLGVQRIDDGLKLCRVRLNDLKNQVAGLSAGLGEREPLVAEHAEAAAAILSATACHAEAVRDATKAGREAAEASESLAASEERRTRLVAAQAQASAAKQASEAAGREVARVVLQLEEAARAGGRVKAGEPYLAPLPTLLEQEVGLTRAELMAGQRADLLRQRDQAERDASRSSELIADAERQAALYIGDFKLAALERDLTDARKELDGLRVGRTVAIAKAQDDLAQAQADAKKNVRATDLMRFEGEDGSCPVCTRRLDAESFQIVLAELSRAAREISDRAKAAKARLEEPRTQSPREAELSAIVLDLDIKANDARQRKTGALVAARTIEHQSEHRTSRLADFDNLEKKLAQLGNVTFDAERLAYVKGEIRRLREMEKALEPDRALVARIPELEADHKQRGRAYADAKARVEQLEQACREVGFDAEEHDVLAQIKSAAAARKFDADVRVAETKQRIKSATDWQGRVAESLATYDERAGRLTELTRDLRTHERTAERLVEFRNAVASTIRPEMEELVSGLINLLTDGRHESAKLTEDFDIILQESGVDVPVISGGTEDVVALSMRLAISQMIAERAGHPLSLLVLDEPMTSLDEVRRTGAIAMLRRLQSVFVQILIVSHIPEIRESVDHCIEIIYSEADGCSRVIQPAMNATLTEEEVAA